MNLTIGRTVELDPLAYRFWPDDCLIKLETPSWLVVAQGHVDLGSGSHLHRFYPSDDNAMLQMQGGAGGEVTEISEVMIWTYHGEVYPSSDQEWESFGKSIRQRTYTLPDGGQQYERAWFDTDEEEVAPITYWETVYDNREGTQQRRIFQTGMLFARTLSDGEDEMLLVNMEEPDDGDRAVCFMLGRMVSPHNLK